MAKKAKKACSQALEQSNLTAPASQSKLFKKLFSVFLSITGVLWLDKNGTINIFLFFLLIFFFFIL